MNDNLPAGCKHSDFEDDTSVPSYVYQNRMTNSEQSTVCLEFLEAKKLHADYEDWRSEKSWRGSWVSGVKMFCEAEPTFWAWLNDSHRG